ncbi:MAG: hypothetical protein ABIF08_03860 [Nanoarchaeota archaeon]
MNEWKKLPVTELKRLVKSRSGRIAELQVEIDVLKSIINQKLDSGDLGEFAPKMPEEFANPKTVEKRNIITTEKPKEESPKETIFETAEKQSTLTPKEENSNLGELDL